METNKATQLFMVMCQLAWDFKNSPSAWKSYGSALSAALGVMQSEMQFITRNLQTKWKDHMDKVKQKNIIISYFSLFKHSFFFLFKVEQYLQDLNGAATRRRTRAARDGDDEEELVKLGIKVVERCTQHLDDSVGKERLPRSYKALNILKLKLTKTGGGSDAK